MASKKESVVLQISPPRKQLNKPPSPIKKEILVLAPFNPVPKVCFINVPTGKTERRSLILRNPSVKSLKIVLWKVPHVEKSLSFSSSSVVVSPGTDEVLDIFWSPKRTWNFREQISIRCTDVNLRLQFTVVCSSFVAGKKKHVSVASWKPNQPSDFFKSSSSGWRQPLKEESGKVSEIDEDKENLFVPNQCVLRESHPQVKPEEKIGVSSVDHFSVKSCARETDSKGESRETVDIEASVLQDCGPMGNRIDFKMVKENRLICPFGMTGKVLNRNILSDLEPSPSPIRRETYVLPSGLQKNVEPKTAPAGYSFDYNWVASNNERKATTDVAVQDSSVNLDKSTVANLDKSTVASEQGKKDKQSEVEFGVSRGAIPKRPSHRNVWTKRRETKRVVDFGTEFDQRTASSSDRSENLSVSSEYWSAQTSCSTNVKCSPFDNVSPDLPVKVTYEDLGKDIIDIDASVMRDCAAREAYNLTSFGSVRRNLLPAFDALTATPPSYSADEAMNTCQKTEAIGREIFPNFDDVSQILPSLKDLNVSCPEAVSTSQKGEAPESDKKLNVDNSSATSENQEEARNMSDDISKS